MLTKTLTSHRGHKMHLNVCWPNTSYASKDTKCILTCIIQTPPMCDDTKYTSTCLTKPIPCQWGHKMHLNKCWTNPSKPARALNVSQLVLNKLLKCQGGHNILLIKCWQPPPMPARTKKESQHVLNKPIPCQRGHKMHLNMCWSNQSHASEHTKCI